MKIVITGASSGLGAALAREYARAGAELFLSGRDQVRLGQVAQECRQAGANVSLAVLDVADAAAMAGWISGVGEIDLLIANAGISAGTGEGGESVEQARRIFTTNVGGVLNTVAPAVPGMVARGQGQIAIISSLAGFRGLPGAPAYCASKAAVRVYGEALRADLLGQGVRVSVVCPGFIRTPMTDVNRFSMPLLMEAPVAAALIVRQLARKKGRIAFPLRLYLGLRLLDFLPGFLVDRLLPGLPRKGAVANAADFR